jgi:uncharacterized protein Yka (UPF0111/DUF47 family)
VGYSLVDSDPEGDALRLLPKDEKFFEFFQQQSVILCQAAQLLLSGLEGGYEGMSHVAKRMEALERSGDEVMHRLFDRLRQTFITPFDPEDIQSLALFASWPTESTPSLNPRWNWER